MRSFFLTFLLFAYITLIAQEQEIAFWKMSQSSDAKEIIDSKGSFSLKQRVSFVDGVWSGMASEYWSQLDLRDKSWSVEGYFRTNGKVERQMMITGTRSGLSKYSGWDFSMLKTGEMRFLVADDNGKVKQIISTGQKFDDGQEHQFKLQWDPVKGLISMIVNQKKITLTWDTDLGENNNRRFFIGAQPKGGGMEYVFAGELRNISFKSSPDVVKQIKPDLKQAKTAKVNTLSNDFAKEGIIASWPLDPKTNQSEIVDATGNFTLTKSVSASSGTYSGVGTTYWPSLDLRKNSFSFEGTFKTNGEADAVMAIAGNRSAISGYTGWDFMMLKNGVLRFLVNDNNGKSKHLMSAVREFDDGIEHQFVISWEAPLSTLTMTIDKKYKYSTFLDGDLGENSGRVFYIGAQPTVAGGKTIPFKGELRNFVFKSVLSESKAATTTADARTLESMDKEMARAKVEETTLWVDAKNLTIEGMGWKEGIAEYTRIPDKYQTVVTSKVWSLSRNSAGISVHFTVKGTAFVNARWTLKGNGYMAHMTSQAVNGLDLYVKMNGKWVWAGVGKPTKDGLQQETSLKGGFLQDKTYECMVYLPLYTGISAIQMGFSLGSTVTATTPNTKKPMVFYGTSILHGCSASRAGMAFPSMLGRRFDTPIVNLGFSGNGLMEEHFGDIMGDIDASVYIIDCLPNMSTFTPEEITARTLALVRKLRSLRPKTPIVLVEDRNYGYADLAGPVVNNRRPAMKAAYNTLITETTDLYYVEGDQLLGEDTEATVDGSHPSDLGMYRYFVALEPVISRINCCK